MANRNETEVLFKKEIKYTAAIGDWTQYRPPKPLIRRPTYIPYKISRIHYKELSQILEIHSQFITHFLGSLQDSFKSNSELFTSSVEQLYYNDLLKRINVPLLYAKLAVPDLGEILFCMDFALLNAIINFSLGCPNKIISPRSLTEVEESIIMSIIGKNLDDFAFCWKNIFKKPEFRIISCPAILQEQGINLNEIITQFNSVFSIGGSPASNISFIYQNNLLRSLINSLKLQEEGRALDLSKIPQPILESTTVPVNIELGKTCITTGELFNMGEGDIIQLDTKLSELLTVKINDAITIPCQLGVKENKFAIRLAPYKIDLSRETFKKEEMPVPEDIIEEEKSPEEDIQAEEETPIAETGEAEKEEEEEFPLEEQEKEGYNTPEKEEDIFGDESNR